jgi:hypothetical protein
MEAYKYLISNRAKNKINQYYSNVAKKYSYSYSFEMMNKNIDTVLDSMYKIENGLIRRTPTISRWNKYYMAHADKWYFAYTIDDDTIHVVDACHSRNMHEIIIKDNTYTIFEFWNRLSKVI